MRKHTTFTLPDMARSMALAALKTKGNDGYDSLDLLLMTIDEMAVATRSVVKTAERRYTEAKKHE